MLTTRQQACLDFIGTFLADHSYPPSLADIADGLGIKSRAQAHAVVAQLVTKGKIKKERYRARSIQII